MVWIHFLSDVFGLLLSRNYSTMATWRNDSIHTTQCSQVFNWIQGTGMVVYVDIHVQCSHQDFALGSPRAPSSEK